MSTANKRDLHDYRPPEFTQEQKLFLGAAGWAAIPADELVEHAVAIEATRPVEIERVTYLTRELLRAGLFAERRRAYAFARHYVTLVDAGADLRLVVWDWE